MAITASLSVSVLGEGTSVGRFVEAALDALAARGVKHQPGPMATAIEAKDLATLFRAVEAAHDAVAKAGAKRIVLHLAIDHRLDKDATLESKVASLRK